jgi:hypothetical protein
LPTVGGKKVCRAKKHMANSQVCRASLHQKGKHTANNEFDMCFFFAVSPLKSAQQRF